ncbi:MAG: nitroreductase family protein [Phycisphaerae bacterium]|jgi:SagB-type dehydrogenase family enzyme
MKKNIIFAVICLCGAYVFAADEIIRLPEPKLNGSYSLEQLIAARRSVREFTDEQVKINQLSQLCFAAQGITDKEKKLRAVPSAGAIYPMQVHAVLPDGLYLYDPAAHTLIKKLSTDIRPMLFVASFRQQVVQKAPCTIIISGSARKIEAKYRGKGERFITLEAGHIAQNLHLQAVAEGLGSVPIGSFDSKSVARICNFTEEYEPLYLICLGTPAQKPALEPLAAAPQAGRGALAPAGLDAMRVVVIVPAMYFSDMEFFGVQETLQLVGIIPDIAAMTIEEMKSQNRRDIVKPNVLIKDINVDDYDAFIFVGGPGVREYISSQTILRLVRAANEKKKIIAAIDNAPGIFAMADVVKGKTVASFPSEHKRLITAGAIWKNSDVEVDGNIITAANPDSARRFGSAVIGALRQQTK